MCRSRTPTSIVFPFADDAAGLLFGGETLLQLQERSARECGLQVVDVDDDAPLPEGAAAFVARDVVFSAATLRALLQHGLSSPVRAVVKSGTTLFEASTRLLEVNAVDLALPLWAGKLAGLHPGKLEGKDVVVADEDGAVVVDTSPLGVAPHQLLVADVERLLGRPTHWLHVLELSLAAARTRLRAHHPVERRGKRSPRVHPTAYIANSILGAGVRVEAHASVIDSVIGDDVIVADHTVIHSSVIGERCRTLVDMHLRRVVAMPGSTLSNLDMQDAIFGREVFVTTGVAFFHDGPGRNVVVDGKDSGRAVLGGAIGARSVLGSRALFRCGVALPSRLLVVARPEEAVGKFDELSMSRAAVRLGDRGRDV